MKIISALILTNALMLTFGRLLISEEPVDGIDKCIVWLIAQDNVKNRSIIYVTESVKDMHYVQSVTNPLIITSNNNPNYTPYGISSNYVIYTKDHNSLRATLQKLKTNYRWINSNAFDAKFIIIISDGERLKEAFRVLCDYDITNVALLNKNSTAVVLHGSLTCMKGIGATSDIKIRSSYCGQNKIFEKDLFDYSLSNLHRRKIILVLHTNRAFPTLVDPNTEPPALLKHFLTLLATRSNATIEYKVLVWKGNQFLDESAETVVTTYYLARSGLDFQTYDLSNMLYLDTMVWIVPKSQPLPAVQVIGLIFDVNIWITIVVVYLVIAVMWFLFDKANQMEEHGSFVRCALMAFALVVSNASAVLPKYSSLRILLLAYFIYTMNIATIFQTKLNVMLLNPGNEPKITSVSEMLDSKLEPLITKLAYKQINDSTSVGVMNLLKKAKVSFLNITGNLHLVAYSRNSSTHIGEQILNTYKTEKKMVDIIDYSCGIPNIELGLAIRKGHPLLFLINKFISRYLENGFIIKWNSDFYRTKYEPTGEEEKTVITMQHLKTMVILWSLGISAAFVVFLMEIVYAKKFKIAPQVI